MLNRFAFIFVCSLACQAENWPQWRGPRLNGISGEKNLPLRWSLTENIAWKLAVPSVSGATPIIWGERIFLNIADGDRLELWCVNRGDGSVLWKRPIGAGNTKYRKGNSSSPSPVTDGKNVWVLTGTGMLKAFDFEGRELWVRDIQKDYGRFGHNHGYASSPLLLDDSLYVPVLHGMKTDDPSYLLRINRETGKTVWRVERPTDAISESPDSYSTPQVLRTGGKIEIVVNGGDCVTAHDPATGKELWRGNGLNPTNDPNFRVIASPVVDGDVVFVPTRIRPFVAFRGGGRGDITETRKVWTFQNGPDVPSPIADGKYFYSVGDKGIMWCLDEKTGKEIYGGQRIKPATYSSSPVLADGKIYATNEDGVTVVLKAGPTFEVLAENNLDDYTLSSPAISEGQIFMRTTKFVYAIGKRSGR